MENIFEIKNNFIPKQDQEKINEKFGRDLERGGNMIEPMLGTEDIMQKPELPLANPAIIGQVPVPVPGAEEETYDDN
jgi:hypothetical protein